jgi:hypothetical protein
MTSATKIRTGLTAGEIKLAFPDNLCCGLAQPEGFATKHDLYVALALTVRDRLFERTVNRMEDYGRANARRVAYLSAEFLPGPHLANNLLNLGITEPTHEALRALGYDLDDILAQEEEPGLGNGGLGRLAACYMDSLASVEVPAIGYGSRVISKLLSLGGKCLVTADHGNCELMRNPDGSPNTVHTTNLVHFIYVAGDAGQFRVEDGILADVAPTLLFLLRLPQPVEMTGRNSLVRCRKDKK